VWALPVWTLFVWATRIRIVLSQDGSKTAVIVPVVLTVLAIAALVDRRRWLPALIVATVAIWAVRLPLVLVHDHAAAFKLVHAALAAISFALCWVTWRGLRRSTSASPTRRSSARC
jgi:NADH:ubiquinone oxidoreductase subunit K